MTQRTLGARILSASCVLNAFISTVSLAQRMPAQDEINAIGECQTVTQSIDTSYDPLTGYWLFAGRGAERMRECLTVMHGWDELGPPAFRLGTMSAPRTVTGVRFRLWASREANFDQLTKYFVVTETDDELGVNGFIIDTLLKQGLEASGGAVEDIPVDTQVKITYETSYRPSESSGFLIFFRDPETNVVEALMEMESARIFSVPDVISTATRYLLSTEGSVETPSLRDLTRQYESRERDPEASVPELAIRGNVSVVNEQPSRNWPTMFPDRSRRRTEYIDFQQLVEVAKGALEQYSRDAQRADDARRVEKSIALAITDVSVIPSFETVINFTVETGNGYFQGLQASGRRSNYRGSIDNAVADMLVQLLNDPKVAAYLEE